MIEAPAVSAAAVDRLAELLEVISREHALAIEAGENLLTHAIRCGEALIEARTIVPRGQWLKWLGDNRDSLGCHHGSIYRYMRVAHYRIQIEQSGVESINAAQILVRRAPALRNPHNWNHPDQRDMDEARRLWTEGDLTKTQISEILGVNRTSIYQWLRDDNSQKRYLAARRKRRATLAAERAILKREAEARRARAVGGGVSEAYSLLRKLAQQFDELWREGSTAEIRAACGDALSHLHKAEDAFTKALR